MPVSSYDNNLDMLLASLVADGYSVRTFEADQAVEAIKGNFPEENFNNLETWTALQDGVESGFLIVNRLGQYRLTDEGVKQGIEALRGLSSDDLGEFGVYGDKT